MEPCDPPTSPNTASRIFRAKSFKRQNTSKSALRNARSQTYGRAESFKVQAEKEAAQPKRCQQSVRAYANLTWEVLHDFLLKKWPNEQFKGEKIHDSWVFEAPEPLTLEDYTAITKLRDNGIARYGGRRKSVTPE